MSISRRHFIVLSGLSIGTLGLGAGIVRPLESLKSTPLPHPPVAAVFGDNAYTALHDRAERYDPPTHNSATVTYVNSLSEEQLMRRHYYC